MNTKEISIQRTSKNTAEIVEDIVLDETSTTRKIFRASVVDNHNSPKANVRGFLIHQRKNIDNKWDNITEEKLSNLKNGEGIKIELKSEVVKNLYDYLSVIYDIANNGIKQGRLSINLDENNASELVRVPLNRNKIITELVNQDFSEEILIELSKEKPEIATKFAYAKLYEERKLALDEFEQSLQKDFNESYWQKFFAKNTWIFGYGLDYKFNDTTTGQPIYGGTTFNNKNTQKGDFLLNSVAYNKFTVLVEIKKPNTVLLSTNKTFNRNGSLLMSGEFFAAISQLMNNIETWVTKGSQENENIKLLETTQKIFTFQPKGILVIGNTQELDDNNKIKSFELLRRNIINPEIITFDELFERAKFIMGEPNEKSNCSIDKNNFEVFPF